MRLQQTSEVLQSFFTKLAGTRKLQQQIEDGKSEADIRESWETGLEKFKK
jgi:hypothetical protein